MTKYVEIFYDKVNKTQRFVFCGPNDCLARVEKILISMGVKFTNSKFIGRYKELENYKDKTYKYAKKWQWLNTIDITKGEN